jgi:hypothetical protein
MAMNSDAANADPHHSLGRDRARLINDRILAMDQIREKCESARAQFGEVPDEHRLALHNSIRTLYMALRPLRDKDAVADFWEGATLSERWGTWVEAEASDDDSEIVDIDDDGNPVFATWHTYQGIDRIDGLRDPVAEREVIEQVFGGEKTETVVEPDPLPYDVLLDISTSLEDATERLGFAPETKVPDQTDPAPI